MTTIDYDKYADQYFRKLTEQARTKQPPIAIYTMGIPASGKSTSVKYVLPRLKIKKNTIVDLDPDEIMMSFPQYSTNISDIAMASLNKAAVIISSKVLAKLIESKVSFVYYGTGKNFSSYRGMFSKTNKAGYVNGLINVQLNSDEAIMRNSARNRSVGPSVIKDISFSLKTGLNAPRYAKGKTPFEALRDLDIVDFVYEVDTSSNPPSVDLVKTSDKLAENSNSASQMSVNANMSVNSSRVLGKQKKKSLTRRRRSKKSIKKKKQ